MPWADETLILSVGWECCCSAWFESWEQLFEAMFETGIFLVPSISNRFSVPGFLVFLIDHLLRDKALRL